MVKFRVRTCHAALQILAMATVAAMACALRTNATDDMD